MICPGLLLLQYAPLLLLHHIDAFLKRVEFSLAQHEPGQLVLQFALVQHCKYDLGRRTVTYYSFSFLVDGWISLSLCLTLNHMIFGGRSLFETCMVYVNDLGSCDVQ